MGMHTPTYGLPFDIILTMLHRAIPSMQTAASRALYMELRAALLDSHITRVAVLSHTTGAIPLSSVLTRLSADLQPEKLSKLEIFTFGAAVREFATPLGETKKPSPAGSTPRFEEPIVEDRAGIIAVQRLVKDGTVIKDVDALDLLEWATGSLQDESEFPHTLGPLKVRVISEIVSLLDQFSASETLRPIYLRNILLARVAASFQLGTSDLTNNDAFLTRSEELQRYIESQCSSPACFDDIKRFVEQLDPEEMKNLAFEYVPQLAKRQQDPLHTAVVKTLAYQLQYLILTAPNLVVQVPVGADAKPRWRSVINGVEGESEICLERFQGVAESAASLYRALVDSIGSSDGQDPDCVPELAILTATALVKLSGLRADRSNHLPSPLHVAQSDRVLQAALILEYQLTRTPKHSRVTLLLVRIHLILGTISRAKEFSLHGLFHLRDAAAAIRLATSYITSFNENEKARDKSGQSCLPKETLAHAKALDSAAAKAFAEGKARIALLKKELVSGNLESRLGSWTAAQSSDDSLAKEIRAAVGDGFDDWKRIVADSWRTNVKGWELVKWE
ncbi:hypothetical protein HYQ44_020450 [Verticillium longisporum]|nr:hypothetical protein HYQ44_020450 [Verticillium longisporum]